MQPQDFRNATFDSLRSSLNESRADVLSAWGRIGPGTTREVSNRSGIDILTFRPRTTDLFQMGLLKLAPEQPHKGEGVYVVASREEWDAWKRVKCVGQMEMELA